MARMSRPASAAAMCGAAVAAVEKVGVSVMWGWTLESCACGVHDIVAGVNPQEFRLADKPLHMDNLITIVSVTILVGTELVGVSWAAGWAIGGIFQLPPIVSAGVEVLGGCFGLMGLYYFVRAALKVEPIRG